MSAIGLCGAQPLRFVGRRLPGWVMSPDTKELCSSGAVYLSGMTSIVIVTKSLIFIQIYYGQTLFCDLNMS